MSCWAMFPDFSFEPFSGEILALFYGVSLVTHNRVIYEICGEPAKCDF